MKRLTTCIAAAALLGAMTSCETSTSTTSPDAAIEEPTGAWELHSFQLADGSSVPVAEPSRYTLELGVREAGRTNIQADCNRCFGDYDVAASTITFGAMGCTRVACPAGSLENDYLLALGTAATFERSPGALSLTYDDGVMVFREQ